MGAISSPSALWIKKIFNNKCCWGLFHVLLTILCHPRAFAGAGSGFARVLGCQSGFFLRERLRGDHKTMSFHGVFSCWDHQWPLPGWCFGADISARNGQLKALLLFWPECEMQQMGLALSAAHKSPWRGLHAHGVPQFPSQNITKPKL